jgi:GNAT superfamily N-acetyltransferase
VVEIRDIGATDSIEELTKLLNDAYAYLGNMGLNYTAVDQSPATTTERIKAGQCFVAVAEDRLVGTIVVEPPIQDPLCPYFGKPGVASAHQLAVAPSHQRRGIGSRLLTFAESWARSNGYSELALDTAEPAHHLVALYSSRGYRHVGVVQWNGKRYRSVIMAKKLNNAA